MKLTNSQKFYNGDKLLSRDKLFNFDLLQDQAGLIVPNLAEKKQQFIELHNELRTLFGKETREGKVNGNI